MTDASENRTQHREASRTEAPAPGSASRPVPSRAGVGLKADHYHDILEGAPDLGWFEVHAENYMGAGGPPHRYLTAIRQSYPLSVHGVGLSIGGAEPLDRAHLARLKAVVDRYEPGLVSEHLAWSVADGVYLNDLLPVPYDEASFQNVKDHVEEVQDTLGRQILIENPSTYLTLSTPGMEETEFLGRLARESGCGLLLDVNNIHVSATNHGFDADAYVDRFPMARVQEIHMAGHAEDRDRAGDTILIDAHGSPVIDRVWELYDRVLARTGPLPTLVEWDNDIPAWSVLFAEAERVERRLAAAAPLRSKGSCEENDGLKLALPA